MYEKVDLQSWNRKDIFSFFENMSNPFYVVSFRQDVTKLYDFVKKNNLSFYYSLVYLCTRAVNEIDAFHYVIKNGEVYRIDRREPSFTDLKSGSENFYIVTLSAKSSIFEFNKSAKARSINQTKFIDQDSETDTLIYFSCLPWIDITAITNERDLLARDAKDDSVPRISWGKYIEKGGCKELGISVELNHRLVDGVHIGMFAEKLSNLIDELD